MTPLSLGGVLGSGDELTSLRLASTLGSSPLIPPDNPLLQLGAILSGFASGTQGQPNPIIAQAMKRQEQDVTRRLALARLGLDVNQANQANEHRQKLEEFESKRLDLQKQDADLRLGTSQMEAGDKLNLPDLWASGIKRLRGTGVVPNWTDDMITTAATDRVKSSILEKKGKSMWLDVLAKQPSADVDKYAPQWKEFLKDPAKVSLMNQRYQITNPKLQLLEEQSKESTAQLNIDRAAAAKRVAEASRQGLLPDPTDQLMSGIEMTPERMTTLGLNYRSQSKQVPPVYAPYVSKWDKSVQAVDDAHAANLVMQQLHNEQLSQIKSMRPLQEMTQLYQQMSSVATVLEKTDLSVSLDKNTKATLTKRLQKMLQTQADEINKRTAKESKITGADEAARAAAESILKSVGSETEETGVAGYTPGPFLRGLGQGVQTLMPSGGGRTKYGGLP